MGFTASKGNYKIGLRLFKVGTFKITLTQIQDCDYF